MATLALGCTSALARSEPKNTALATIKEVVFNMDATAFPRPSAKNLAVAAINALVEARTGMRATAKGNALHVSIPRSSDVVLDWPPSTAREVMSIVTKVVNAAYPKGMPRTVGEDVVRAIARSVEDPYTAYLSPQESRRLRAASREEEATPGIELSPYDPTRIREVRPGSGAARAGIRTGDRIVTIDGRLAKALTLAQLGSLLFGPTNSRLHMGIRSRETREVRSVLVRRSLMPEEPVTLEILPKGIVYVRVAAFAPRVAQKVAQVLWERRSSGIILDLRHNQGGLIEEGAALLDLFFSNGPLAAIQVRKGRPSRLFNATRSPTDLEVPLVVLIDGASASASELVSMVLKERERATVLGSRSVGKGSVQELIGLPDGGWLRVTNGAYVGPRQRPLPRAGVTPDLFLAPPRGRTVLEGGSAIRDAWVLSAVDVLQSTRTALARGTAGPLFGPMP